MPQLDKVTFLSQFFWLCVFFSGFFIFQLKFFLPKMSRILKFRKKRVSESGGVLFQKEESLLLNSSETLSKNLFKNSKNFFKDSFSKECSWFLKKASIFQKKLERKNRSYFKEIALKNLSNLFAIKSVLLPCSFSGLSSKNKIERISLLEKNNSCSNNLSNQIFLSRLSPVVFALSTQSFRLNNWIISLLENQPSALFKISGIRKSTPSNQLNNRFGFSQSPSVLPKANEVSQIKGLSEPFPGSLPIKDSGCEAKEKVNVSSCGQEPKPKDLSVKAKKKERQATFSASGRSPKPLPSAQQSKAKIDSGLGKAIEEEQKKKKPAKSLRAKKEG